MLLFRKINSCTFNFYRYCGEHSRKAQIARIKSMSRRSLPQTPEMLLLNLSHYAKPIDSSAEDTEDEGGKIRALDPFSKHRITLNYLHFIYLCIYTLICFNSIETYFYLFILKKYFTFFFTLTLYLHKHFTQHNTLYTYILHLHFTKHFWNLCDKFSL